MAKTWTSENGEVMEFPKGTRIYTHECCDCGLTHLVRVDVKKKRAFIRWYRDDFATRIAHERGKP